MHTGDGIERAEVDADASLASDGGEGGSVLQALGSKGSEREQRAKRRKNKKDSYAKYLESPTWRKIRARALKRDKHTCRACGEKAQVVHHVRYPERLGQEKMEWLYSLCAPCHNAIHRAAEKMPLRHATDLILGGSSDGSVVRLADDWQLSPAASRNRTLGRRGSKQKKLKLRKPKKKKPQKIKIQHFEIRAAGPRLGDPEKPRKKSMLLSHNNDELHAYQARARENRERRRQANG